MNIQFEIRCPFCKRENTISIPSKIDEYDSLKENNNVAYE